MSVQNNFIGLPESPAYPFDRQFPGMSFGGTIEEVRNLITKQKRIQGRALPLVVGFNEFTFKLSGTARMLLGFTLFTGIRGNTFTIVINDEAIIMNAGDLNFCFTGRNKKGDFYEFPRPLTGQDIVKIQYTTSLSFTQQIIFHYL